MIIASSKTFLLVLCLLLGASVRAQNKPFLWQPEVDLNYQLDAHWNFNFQTSFRSTWDFEIETFDTEIQGNHVQFAGRVNYRNNFDDHIDCLCFLCLSVFLFSSSLPSSPRNI